MYPQSLALVVKDPSFSLPLARHLRNLGIDVSAYADGPSLLADADAFAHRFYVVDFARPSVDNVGLIQTLRKRSDAGILVLSDHTGPKVFHDMVFAGADMHLAKPLPVDQVSAAVMAVQRRAVRPPVTAQPWTLHRAAGELLVPDGARVTLSDIDCSLLECFADARGEPVSRHTLAQRLGRHGHQGAEGLNAVVYRLRRRIERATPLPVPLQSKSRVGYFFKAPLHLL
jgi:two-component system, OmpR family, response regulator